MGVGHVPAEPVRPEGEGAHLQGRQRRGASPDRAVVAPHLARGRRGEDLAAGWYEHHGYRIVARNWRCRTDEVVGEVDIIAAAPGVVVFCEVKARADAGFGGPEGAVGHRKQGRLRRLAVVWLAQHRPGSVSVRFDVAVVVGERLTVIEAAF